jgi:cation diffusion facilitator CzcD-associated flavoprotein CzcO
MHQRRMDFDEERRKKQDGRYESAFEACRKTRGGVPYEPVGRRTFDDTPEERKALWNSLMTQGGFRFWVASYNDLSTDQRANDAAYAHWRGTVLKRVRDPRKAALVAPEKPPHPYGAKRPSLEQNYFEVLSQDNVEVVDLNQSPIHELTATGITTAAGHVDVDLIVLATGFDGLTGGFLDIDLRGTNSRTLKQYWDKGARTSTGVAIPGFPNMFFIFGPQAPSTFS